MKKIIILLIFLVMSLVLPTSCTKFNEYLDQAPEQGLTDEQIFTKLENFRLFFDAVYSGRLQYSGSWRDFNIKMAYQLYWDMWDQKYKVESVTDASDNGRYMEGHAWKSGNMSETIVNKMTYDGARNPVLQSMLYSIRVCNIALRNVDKIQDANDATKNDFRGQAYFVRALAHLTLMNWWGPFPYLDYVVSADSKTWDIPRLPKHEYLTKVAMDFDSSYNCFKLAGLIRRDPPLGQPNHLVYGGYREQDGGNRMFRANGMAAKGFQARALLYRASPLNTEGDPNDWKEAAAKSWEALQVAMVDGGCFLLTPLSNKKLNFTGSMVTDEELFTYSYGNLNWDGGNQQGTDNRGIGATMWNGAFGASTSWSGVCPTQNYVDKYETAWGDPLNTQADRDAATAIGHYNEQTPYANRDPRFSEDIMYNQSPCLLYGNGADYGTATNTAQIFYWKDATGAVKQSQLLIKSTYPGMTYTGYYLRKFWWNNSTLNRVTGILTDPVMRLAEVYLNYAEAANEAYGPNTPAPGATLTAVQAVNIIRTRAGMPNVLAAYTANKDVFRERIKNERNIELAFEGHYYNDIHRWMDLQKVMSSTLIGMDIERLSLSPLVFKYTRLPLSQDRQPVWKPQMYYLPFNNADNLKMSKFVPNPVW